jgi:hypothetical protein
VTVLERFLAYAADFEKTLADDDWSRLEKHFRDDAVYRVESGSFGCELTGRDAIFAGMKKSLDGFDRKFTSRDIATESPKVEGDEMTVSWTVTYHQDGLPDFVLPGRSRARLDDGGIALLVDSYDEGIEKDLEDWTRQAGVRLDPSYT